MRELKAGLEIKPGATVELKPGGYHIMFMDLKQPLEQGQRIKGALTFEKGGTIEVEFAVEAAGAPAHTGHGH
jgi:copper(I)-binding protein